MPRKYEEIIVEKDKRIAHLEHEVKLRSNFV